jgi:hypothetical protein
MPFAPPSPTIPIMGQLYLALTTLFAQRLADTANAERRRYWSRRDITTTSCGRRLDNRVRNRPQAADSGVEKLWILRT